MIARGTHFKHDDGRVFVFESQKVGSGSKRKRNEYGEYYGEYITINECNIATLVNASNRNWGEWVMPLEDDFVRLDTPVEYGLEIIQVAEKAKARKEKRKEVDEWKSVYSMCLSERVSKELELNEVKKRQREAQEEIEKLEKELAAS